MNRLFLSFTLLCLFLTASVSAQHEYSNPIIHQDAADPTVIRADDGLFYLYSTGARLFRSSDMVSWEYLGSCFARGNQPSFVPGVRSIWAPDINKIGKRYVLYFAMSKWGGIDSCGVGAAWSDTPVGPFQPVGEKGKLFRSYEIGVRNSIDPFYILDKGKNWLLWGSFHGIYAIRLSKDGLSLYPDSKPIPIAGNAYEGTYVYKRKGYYYFFASIGSCCDGAKSTYTTIVARSKKLLGPYVDRQGHPLLSNHHEILIHSNDKWAGTGHNAEILEDKNGDTFITYHAYEKAHSENGRVALMDKVMWDDEGWPYVENSTPSDKAPSPVF